MAQVGQHDLRGHFVRKSVVLDSSTEITGVNSYKDLSLLVNFILTSLSRKSAATISLIVLNRLEGARTTAMKVSYITQSCVKQSSGSLYQALSYLLISEIFVWLEGNLLLKIFLLIDKNAFRVSVLVIKPSPNRKSSRCIRFI